jgi:aminopeptidase N
MSLKKSSLSLAVLLIVVACHSRKNTNSTAPEKIAVQNQAIVFVDSPKVVKNEAPKRELYRESTPKLSDILHTRLDVRFDWQNSRLMGTATIDLKQHFYPSEKLFLNARGMDINNLEVYELVTEVEKKKPGAKADEILVKPLKLNAAGYKYENDSLKINLGKVFTATEKFRVVIEYVSKPNELKESGSNAITSDKGLYFINPLGENRHKMPQIWTQGETQSNSAWFPTIDSPNEKMTQDIYMTVEDKYTTLSNGYLAESKKNADGSRTDHWKLEQPHAPYLVMMAVGQFKKVLGEPWNGREVSYYVEKEYEPHAKVIFGDTKEMIEFYSSRLGVPYPWPKYAQVVARDYVSGAMENTSATLHGDGAVYQTTREMIDGKKGEDVIAHELFHQWFGDLVTCESWSNLPLNESFATYGEYLWQEYKHGRDAADYHHVGSRQGYMRSSTEVDLIRFSYGHREEMFDGFSYSKGGQVLHMLRKAVGDEAFFTSLQNYLETNKYKAAEIHHLRLAFEEVTGRDMNWFFNQWFLNKGRPKLKVDQKYNSASGMVELNVEQYQDFTKAPLYQLPIDVDVYINGKAQRTRIMVAEQKQTFSLPANTVPQLVNFDAERQLLCDLEYPKSDEEYVFQYRNAPLFEDRIEALKKLENKLNEAPIFELFTSAAEQDNFYALRNFALSKLETIAEEKPKEVKNTLLKVYGNDKKTTTRAKALGLLNKRYAKDADVMALNEKALKEMSYAINGEALEAIGKTNPQLAMEKAKLFEGESGKEVLFPIAELYGNHGSDDQIPFFQSSLKYFNGFEVVTFCNHYTKTAKRCSTPEAVLAAATDLQALAIGATRFTKYGALKGLRDLSQTWENKEKAAAAKIETIKKEGNDTSSLEKELKKISETKEVLTQMYNSAK